MTDLKIKNEYSPVRCDICHQADYFDPINNYCSRCSVLLSKINSLNSQNTFYSLGISKGLRFWIRRGSYIGFFIGLAIGTIYGLIRGWSLIPFAISPTIVVILITIMGTAFGGFLFSIIGAIIGLIYSLFIAITKHITSAIRKRKE